MKVSMWILYENLMQYDPKANIIEGKMCIRNASLLYQSAQVTSHTVYICPSEDFFETMKGKIICANRNDYIVLETDNMEEVFDRVSSIIDFFLEWDMNTKDAIEDDCSLKDILINARPVFRGSLVVMDTAFIIQEMDMDLDVLPPKYRSFIRIGSGMPIQKTVRYVQDFKLLRLKKGPYIYTTNTDIIGIPLFINLFVNNICQCHCLLYYNDPNKTVTIALEQLFSVLADQLERWLKRNGFDNSLTKQERNMLALLETATGSDVDHIRNDYLRLGWDDNQVKYLFIVEHLQKNDLLYTHIIHMFANLYPACQCVLYRNGLVFLINTAILSLQDFTDHLISSFSSDEFTIGISLPFKCLSGLYEPYQQAQIALEGGKGSGKYLSFCGDYILDYAKSFFHKNLPINLSHPVLAELKKDDEANSTEYYRTLKIYLLEQQSQTKTAQILGVHKKTVQYRIQNILEKYHLNLLNQTERLHLLLSFLIFS